MNYICKFCSSSRTNANSLRNHERLCAVNPDRQLTHFSARKPIAKRSNQFIKAKLNGAPIEMPAETRQKIGLKSTERRHTPDVKLRLSNLMKERHEQGLAHNIGQSRWNNEPSYPEKWTMQVIANEFQDKAYTREYPFHKYSLDFVWLHKKKVIEIDGEQHDRFPEQKARDNAKDALLKKEGYDLLRLRWKDIYNDTKLFIAFMKQFIDG